MEDPQGFLESREERRIVLDEVHRLPNPSELLKIAADHYPKMHVLATGSSALSASSKFRDTLVGRMRTVWLTPMIQMDMADAHRLHELPRRFLRGGLPGFFLAPKLSENDFQEWMDAYWSKDIQELFRLEKRNSFQKFIELVMAQSGGIFEATKFARSSGVSHTTIANYLDVLEATFVAQVVRPFSTHRATEIVAAPKVYGFDTGFVCCYRGWQELRREDMGILWEHFVLNEIRAQMQTHRVFYWRDKRGHEVDFVLAAHRTKPLAIECKWSADGFDPKNIKVFRTHYPEGSNVVVAQDVSQMYFRNYGNVRIRFQSLAGFVKGMARDRRLSGEA